MLSSYWDDFPTRSPMGWRMPLQVQRQGGFFTDSLFQGTRNHFDSAIRDIMRSWDVRDTNDHFKSYRMFRDRQLSGTDRPSSLVEEDTIYKVVMDVQGFIENDLKVTFLNDNELVVEGLIEKKTEGSLSRQSFKRRFVMPTKVIVDQATSALSSDNVLTITIPKQLQQITSGNQSSNTTTSTNQTVSSAQSSQISSSTSQNLSSAVARDDFFDNFKSLMEFPITRKKDFFADSFFDDVRGMFQSRVQEIMNRRNRREAIEDVNIFRSLRDKEDQSVAVTVAGDTNQHKIVLDVHGYNEGDIKIKVVTETELIVEGKVEKKTDNSCCHNSFRRSFTIPQNCNLQSATSALSSDGVLTISIPKKPEKPLPIEYSIPVTRVESPSHSERISKLKAEKLSEIQTRREQASTPPIPLGYSGSPFPDITSMLSDQQRTSETKECVIPVTMEDNRESSAQSLSERLQQSSLNQSTEARTEERQSESRTSYDCQSKVTQEKDQSWKDVQIAPKFNARMIPIQTRGSFCDDRVFDSARQRVESAVQSAMKRSTSREQQSETTAQTNVLAATKTAMSTILDDVNNYKISLDVYGFSEKDLNIRIVSKNEISVEGLTEVNKNGSITRHSFERTFHLPDTVNTEAVTSDLSSDGMLTITLPKKKSDIQQVQEMSKDSFSESQSTRISDSLRNNSTGAREYVVPLMMEGGNTESSLHKDLLQTQTRTERENSVASSAQDTRSLLSEISGNTFSTAETARNLSRTRDIAIKPCFDLPISNKGHFYQDSFFNDSRDIFDTVLRNTMDRFKSFSSFPNDSDFFNTLRQERMGNDSQAVASSEDEQFHKVVVDVQGYPQECLHVKVVEGNGILVEGKVEEKSGNASSTKTFRKTFMLPKIYDVTKAVTALSADGILNIKVPRSTTEQSFLTF